MTLCGIVRTANGYALCTAEIEPGAAPKVLSVKCGPSQSHMEYIAMEHKKLIAVLARKVA
jgi:hypothetical protein